MRMFFYLLLFCLTACAETDNLPVYHYKCYSITPLIRNKNLDGYTDYVCVKDGIVDNVKKNKGRV